MDTAFLEVMVSCERCGAKMPLNGPAEVERCTHCFEDVHIPSEVWSNTVSGLSHKLGNFGRGGFARAMHQGPALHLSWTYGRGGPPCPHCQGEMRVDQASRPAWALRCGRCRAPGAVQPVPEWLLAFDRNLAGMVTPPDVAPSTASVVTVRCSNCGSSLDVDGSRRSVLCTYCNGANLLSDEVWQVFHPLRKVQRWWLLTPAPLTPTAEARSRGPLAMVVFATLFLGPFAVIFTVVGLLAVLGFGALAGAFTNIEGGIGGVLGFGIGALGFAVMLGFGLIALAGLLAVYVMAFRMHWREKLVLDSKCEVIGLVRILKPSASGKNEVEVSCTHPAAPNSVIATKRASIDANTRDRLGGDGCAVRAWVDPAKPRHCEVKWEPSPLVGA